MDYFVEVNLNFEIEKIKKKFNDIYGYYIINDLPHKNILNTGPSLLIHHPELDWDKHIVENALDINIHTARFFVTKPRSVIQVHKDTRRINGELFKLREWAINVPIMNCDKGTNVWFDDNEKNIEIYNDSAPAVILKNPQDHKPAAFKKLSGIELFRTDLYHTCDNRENDNYRIILSFRSNDDISWTQMVEKVLDFNLKNYKE